MNSSKLPIVALLAAVIVIAAFYFLDRGYGKVSPDAYAVATSLYGACLSKSEDRLSAIEKILNGDAAQKIEISTEEYEWLTDIVSTARNGNWKSASSSARQMMEDQVEK